MSAKSTPARKTKESPPGIGIGAAHLKKVCSLLADILADQHVLYLKTRNYHWNLVGDRFRTLHEFYEAQYTELALAIDRTAERIRMLGGVSPGSMQEFLKAASLVEASGKLIHGEESIKALTKDHEACARALRKAIAQCEDELDDVGTADFLTDLLKQHEKTAWMLRSFLG